MGAKMAQLAKGRVGRWGGAGTQGEGEGKERGGKMRNDKDGIA